MVFNVRVCLLNGIEGTNPNAIRLAQRVAVELDYNAIDQSMDQCHLTEVNFIVSQINCLEYQKPKTLSKQKFYVE